MLRLVSGDKVPTEKSHRDLRDGGRQAGKKAERGAGRQEEREGERGARAEKRKGKSCSNDRKTKFKRVNEKAQN